MRGFVGKMVAVSCVVFFLAGWGRAGAPTAFHSGGGQTGRVPAAVAAVLLDQPLSTVDQNAYADQDFGPANDAYDIFVADDFTVPADGWTVSALYFDNNTWNQGCDLTCATALHVEVYADNGGAPDGDPHGGGNPPVWSLSVAPTDAQVSLSSGTGGYQSNVLFTLSAPFFLPAGTYWITFYPEMEISGCCQNGRQVADTNNGFDAVVMNPGGGLGFPTTWTPITDASTWNLPQHDVSMRIEGTVGAPLAERGIPALSRTGGGLLLLLLTGAAVILLRRRA